VVGMSGRSRALRSLPLLRIVIEFRDRNTVSEDFNMAVQLELRLPRPAKNEARVVYMQVLHAQAHSMLPLGKQVNRGDRVCRIGFFGMQRIGNPHAHIEFSGLRWSRSTTITGLLCTLIGFGAAFSLSVPGSIASPAAALVARPQGTAYRRRGYYAGGGERCTARIGGGGRALG
jgi:hypothetical protein